MLLMDLSALEMFVDLGLTAKAIKGSVRCDSVWNECFKKYIYTRKSSKEVLTVVIALMNC